MNLEPQKFFIGLLDFFSILLPGALLTYLLMDHVGPLLLGSRYGSMSGNEGGAAFLVSSYLVGHLVFLIGAWWLDEFYDWARGHTRNAVISRVAKRGQLAPWVGRALIWLVFKDESNAAVRLAAAIKHELLEPLQGSKAINTFQWAKAWLTAESGESLSQIHRFEADSKFFRSLVVVLSILIVKWIVEGQTALASLGACLLPLALWRYMDQRLKSTNQAYWSVITLQGRAGKVVFPPPKTGSQVATHAGGVVFRQNGGQAEYLLVEATADPKEWVLPKGHCEAGERRAETAVREVQEETGVWARIVVDLGMVRWSALSETETINFFLMEKIGQGRPTDRDRRRRWVPIAELAQWASHEETRELVQRADLIRMKSGNQV
jgi:ADP-ribose pyrophosphatase YjhB (NUDIX family)